MKMVKIWRNNNIKKLNRLYCRQPIPWSVNSLPAAKYRRSVIFFVWQMAIQNYISQKVLWPTLRRMIFFKAIASYSENVKDVLVTSEQLMERNFFAAET